MGQLEEDEVVMEGEEVFGKVMEEVEELLAMGVVEGNKRREKGREGEEWIGGIDVEGKDEGVVTVEVEDLVVAG